MRQMGFTGWVSGSVLNDMNPGTCSMHCVSNETYNIVKIRMLRWTKLGYNLGLYNCQHWAAEQLSL
jgi:hypothetical protein